MHSTDQEISAQHVSHAANDRPVNVLISAGGTGGHVYPAIAIAEALRQEYKYVNILFVGTKNHLEWKAVPKAGFDITDIWISGFHRRFTLKNLLFPFKLLTSVIQSLGIINRFSPDVAISCGGYAAGPATWVAAKRNVPVVIQEQNSFPGVTNRMLGKNANQIFTAFENAAQHFPKEKISLTGNPTRQSLTNVNAKESYNEFGFTSDKQTLLVIGGSGGARSINRAMLEHIEQLHNTMGLQIIWQCGERYYDRIRNAIHDQEYGHLLLKDFLHKMPEAYEVADLVISRSGALSCSELALTGKPSVLIPSPNVAGDHQTKNAQSMVDGGAAKLVADDELQDVLPQVVNKTITDTDLLNKMNSAALRLAKPDAANHIATKILELVENNREN